jgi:hypothetical protein
MGREGVREGREGLVRVYGFAFAFSTHSFPPCPDGISAPVLSSLAV